MIILCKIYQHYALTHPIMLEIMLAYCACPYLQAVKEEVVKQCQENEQLQKFLSEMATKVEQLVDSAKGAKNFAVQSTKAVTKEVAKVAVKQGARGTVGQVANAVAKQGTKKVAEQVAKKFAKEGMKEVAEQVLKAAAKQGGKKAATLGVKEGAEQVAKAAAKELAEQAAKAVAVQGVKEGAEQVAKAAAIQGVKEGAEQVAKAAAKQGTKAATAQGTKALLKTAATPVGIVADVAQVALEYAGHKKLGKTVGCGGNVASGAMLGAVAGPPGVVVGAVGGFLLWGAGEAFGYLIDQALN